MILLALLIGFVAGLRAMTAPAAIAWAASGGTLNLEGGWLAFMGWRFSPWIFTLLAIAELIGDQLPSAPSRKVPAQFATRILSGGVCGAAIGSVGGAVPAGLLLGIVGAVIGTLGGAAIRARLAAAFGRDLPAALIEDAAAIGGAILIVTAL